MKFTASYDEFPTVEPAIEGGLKIGDHYFYPAADGDTPESVKELALAYMAYYEYLTKDTSVDEAVEAAEKKFRPAFWVIGFVINIILIAAVVASFVHGWGILVSWWEFGAHSIWWMIPGAIWLATVLGGLIAKKAKKKP